MRGGLQPLELETEGERKKFFGGEVLVVDFLYDKVVACAYLIENTDAFCNLAAALWNVELKPFAEVDVWP